MLEELHHDAELRSAGLVKLREAEELHDVRVVEPRHHVDLAHEQLAVCGARERERERARAHEA